MERGKGGEGLAKVNDGEGIHPGDLLNGHWKFRCGPTYGEHGVTLPRGEGEKGARRWEA